MTLKHRFVSTKPDTLDPTKLGPDDWGSSSTDYAVAPTHVFSGGAAGDLLVRDTGAVDGTAWRGLPMVDVRTHGATGDGSTDDTAALQAAVTAASSGARVVLLPEGTYRFNGLTIDTDLTIVGVSRRRSRLNYTGSGTAITITDECVFARLADFFLDNVGAGLIGVSCLNTNCFLERLQIAVGTNAWTTAAVQSHPTLNKFTHTLRDCYVAGHTIGWDILRGQNMVSDHSFFEDCITNVRVGHNAAVCNFAFVNGSVAEQVGASTDAGAVNIDLQNAVAPVIRDSYFETLKVNQRNIRAGSSTTQGGEICGNYFNGNSVADYCIDASQMRRVHIGGNHSRGHATAFVRIGASTAGLQYDASNDVTDAAKFSATPTLAQVLDLSAVTYGVNDSGGAGFKLLRVAN